MELEELGHLFRGDPSFDYIFYHLPRSAFMKIYERRKKRMEQTPSISDIL